MTSGASDDAPTAKQRSDLDRSALFGAAWMGAAKWSTQLISWIGTVVVARLLSPADYGIVSMATVALGLLSLISEFGIGTTIVMQRDIQGSVLKQFNSVALLLGGASFAVAAAMAIPLGVFFRSDVLPWVIVAMATTFVINALQIVPAATLRRELRFRTLALIDVARGFLVPMGTVLFALAGFGYWALVGGGILSATVSTALTLINRRHGFSGPSWAGLRGKLQTSAQILVSRLAWYVYSSADLVIAGRRLGEGPLGEYTLAATVATMPTSKIFALLTDVTPSLFAAVQDDRDSLRRYFLNMTELLAFACFPVAIGLALVADDFVAVVLGSKWQGAAIPLMLLAACSTIRSITPLYGHLFLAVGQSRYSMWTALGTAVLLPIGFWVGSNWGTTGIAATWIVFFPILMLVTFARVRKILSLHSKDYVQSLRLGIDGSIAMGVVVYSLRHWLAIEEPLMRLLVDVPAGAVAFAATTLVLHRTRINAIVEWFQRTRQMV